MKNSNVSCRLGRSAIVSALAAMALTCGAAELDLHSMDLADMRKALDAGRVTSEQLVRHYLNNVQANDKAGKGINAIITLNPQALEQARQWDREHAKSATKTSAPLAGIPYLVKDNYDTEGIQTTGGSLGLLGWIPKKDAFVVAKLRSQGAILIGKTNMSELAASYGRYGYSSAGGQTLNPYNPKRDASGSSSGSAAGVAAGFAAFALGTDTSGSIRGPASVTGLVGLRPTLGLTSRSGLVPLSLTSDVSGALTRSVRDQAIVLAAIAGADGEDYATTAYRGKRGVNGFEANLAADYLKKKVIVVVGNFDGGNEEVDALKERAVKSMQAAGATIVRLNLAPEYAQLWPLALGPVAEAEFKPQFERYLAQTDVGQPKYLKEFIKLLSERSAAAGNTPANPGRIKGLIENEESKKIDSPQYIDILTNVIPGLRLGLAEVLKEQKADAFFFATRSCAASPIYTVKDEEFVCKSAVPHAASYIASAVGFPEITVPVGVMKGNMPVGMSFMGLPGDEAKLLGLGYSLTAPVK